ncbi:MAG: hypothetical protein P8Y67_07135 [Alphaproteobacteria bacterium]
MNADILMQTLDSVGAKVDNLWSMYIVVNLGILWFFFLVHRPLLVIERAIACIGYGGFIYVNGGALIEAYEMLEAVRLDLTKRFSQDFNLAPETYQHLVSQNYDDRLMLIAFSHLGALASIIMLFAFRNVLIRRYYRLFPEQAARQASEAAD